MPSSTQMFTAFFFGRMMNNPYLTIPGWKLSVLSPGLSKHACHSPFWKRLKSPFLMFECHNFMVQSAVWISYFSQNYSWLVVSTYPSEKYDFVSWDDSSQYDGKKQNDPNHQPDSDISTFNWKCTSTHTFPRMDTTIFRIPNCPICWQHPWHLGSPGRWDPVDPAHPQSWVVYDSVLSTSTIINYQYPSLAIINHY